MPRLPGRLETAIVTALIFVGAVRIATTWTATNNTYDEGWHVGVGMEWLDKGQYTYEQKHPPLARIAVALGPWLSGLHSTGEENLWLEAKKVLYQRDTYTKNLTLARAGVLPFFVLAVLSLWLLARHAFGPVPGVAAAGLLSTLPPVLAHAGLATTDVPMLGAFAALLYAATLWLEQPSIRRGVWLGVTGAITLLTKFSSIPYFGLAALLAVIARWRGARKGGPGAGPTTPRNVVLSVGIAGAITFVIAWATYRFTLTPLRGFPIPLKEVLLGLRELAEHNEMGQISYVLGHSGFEGVWYFFPVVVLVKTPIPLLLLAAVGFWCAWRLWRTGADWRALLPMIVVLAVLAVAIPARINLGVRHILPAYLGLCAAGGLAIARLWQTSRLTRVLTAGLVGTYLVTTSITHPDYLTWFNALAGRDPAHVLVDSDLDWGQDLRKFGDEVRRRGIDTLTFEYFGSAWREVHVPNSAPPVDSVRPSGWFAISETEYRRGKAVLNGKEWRSVPDYWSWLKPIEPVAIIGKTIRLYHLP